MALGDDLSPPNVAMAILVIHSILEFYTPASLLGVVNRNHVEFLGSGTSSVTRYSLEGLESQWTSSRDRIDGTTVALLVPVLPDIVQ